MDQGFLGGQTKVFSTFLLGLFRCSLVIDLSDLASVQDLHRACTKHIMNEIRETL